MDPRDRGMRQDLHLVKGDGTQAVKIEPVDAILKVIDQIVTRQKVIARIACLDIISSRAL